MTRARLRVLLGRALVLCVGVALAGYFVKAAGPSHVLSVLVEAGRFLPFIVLLEMGVVTTDIIAARGLLGGAVRSITTRAWIRACALAYASSILLPAGRAAGETVRAATLSGSVGAGTAVTACARLQSCVLVSNAAISLTIGAVTLAGGVSLLPLLLLGNAVVCTVLGLTVFAVARNARVGAWLREKWGPLLKRLGLMKAAGTPNAPAPSRKATSAAIALNLLGRSLQTVQYGVVLLAVGAVSGPVRALTAQGIHLVGAAVGDLIPTQLGAMEGVYRGFARSIGLEDAPARALSIALIVRIAQVGLALACVAIGAAAHPEARSTEGSHEDVPS